MEYKKIKKFINQFALSKEGKRKIVKDSKKFINQLALSKKGKRKIVKDSKVTVTIPRTENYSVLGDRNRYFKEKYEQEKGSFLFK